jgi:glyoxylase-like metal-dependent hydrolase (beta-lactamase superfamily II)
MECAQIMIEIREFEQVIQIRLSRELEGNALYWVAAYLVDGLLIDTGCRYTSGELASYLSTKNISRVVNTHFHEDHVGGNKDIMTKFGVDIYAHPDSIPFIARTPMLYPYQEVVWGHPEPTDVKPIPEIITTDKYSFRVIETPGHCAGHVALMELSKGWCFSGDIFARENIKCIRPEEDIGKLISSMRRILATAGGRLVLFTSVGKIVEDGRRALSSCIDYLTDMAGKVKKMALDNHSVDEIVNMLFGGEHPFFNLTDGQYTSHNLIRSLLEMK